MLLCIAKHIHRLRKGLWVSLSAIQINCERHTGRMWGVSSGLRPWNDSPWLFLLAWPFWQRVGKDPSPRINATSNQPFPPVIRRHTRDSQIWNEQEKKRDVQRINPVAVPSHQSPLCFCFIEGCSPQSRVVLSRGNTDSFSHLDWLYSLCFYITFLKIQKLTLIYFVSMHFL